MDSSNTHIIRKLTESYKHKHININEKESNHINHLLHAAPTQTPLKTLSKSLLAPGIESDNGNQNVSLYPYSHNLEVTDEYQTLTFYENSQELFTALRRSGQPYSRIW